MNLNPLDPRERHIAGEFVERHVLPVVVAFALGVLVMQTFGEREHAQVVAELVDEINATRLVAQRAQRELARSRIASGCVTRASFEQSQPEEVTQ
ncbi:MAG: hypothetical protein MUF08_00595 [Burkholderiaceae bacterium]|jgi:hypothetical protein|nr:hypothetical protein [Burkholderiaceae bacterium]